MRSAKFTAPEKEVEKIKTVQLDQNTVNKRVAEFKAARTNASSPFFWGDVSLSIEAPLGTPPPDKPWARPTRTRVRTVHRAILRLAGVLHGHNLLRAPHKHLQRLCKIWSLVRRITSEVAAAGAAATVSSLSLCGMPIQCGCG